MTEFDTRSVAEILSDSFTLVRRSKYSKRWYSPENLFVTAEPTKRGQASFPSQRNNEA